MPVDTDVMLHFGGGGPVGASCDALRKIAAKTSREVLGEASSACKPADIIDWSQPRVRSKSLTGVQTTFLDARWQVQATLYTVHCTSVLQPRQPYHNCKHVANLQVVHKHACRQTIGYLQHPRCTNVTYSACTRLLTNCFCGRCCPLRCCCPGWAWPPLHRQHMETVQVMKHCMYQ